MLGGTPALWNEITLRDVTVVTYLFTMQLSALLTGFISNRFIVVHAE